VRVLGEVLERFATLLKEDEEFNEYFHSVYDVEKEEERVQRTAATNAAAKGAAPAAVASPAAVEGKSVSDAEETDDLEPEELLEPWQIADCLQDKANILKDDVTPFAFSDIVQAGRQKEVDLFIDTYMFMLEEDKYRFFAQFEQEFARLVLEGFNEIPVNVITAFELDEEQEETVYQKLLEIKVGKATPVPYFTVDENILGGIRIVWGDKYEFDNTMEAWFQDGMNNIRDGLEERPEDADIVLSDQEYEYVPFDSPRALEAEAEEKAEREKDAAAAAARSASA